MKLSAASGGVLKKPKKHFIILMNCPIFKKKIIQFMCQRKKRLEATFKPLKSNKNMTLK